VQIIAQVEQIGAKLSRQRLPEITGIVAFHSARTEDGIRVVLAINRMLKNPTLDAGYRT